MIRGVRGLALAAAVAVLGVAVGCDHPSSSRQGQQVEFVAGGDGVLTGRLTGLGVDAHDTVYVLTSDAGSFTLWRSARHGKPTPVAVRQLKDADIVQFAVSPAGEVIAGGNSGVWRLNADGSVEQLLAVNAQQREPLPDGAAHATLCGVDGVAFDADGTLYVAEAVPSTFPYSIVRSAKSGTLTTVLGKNAPGLTSEAGIALKQQAQRAPDGTPATSVLLNGGRQLLAAGSPGSVFALHDYSALERRPDGTIRQIMARRRPDAVTPAVSPFASRGRAIDADIELDLDNSSAMATDGAETLFALAQSTRRPGHAFDWTGNLSAAQQRLIAGRDVTQEVLMTGPDGDISTAALGAQAIAAHGRWLYLAARGAHGAVVVRTAVPAQR